MGGSVNLKIMKLLFIHTLSPYIGLFSVFTCEHVKADDTEYLKIILYLSFLSFFQAYLTTYET